MFCNCNCLIYDQIVFSLFVCLFLVVSLVVCRLINVDQSAGMGGGSRSSEAVDEDGDLLWHLLDHLHGPTEAEPAVRSVC